MPKVNFTKKELINKFKSYKRIRDALLGQDAIKDAGECYLPMPKTSFNPSENIENYKKYKERAVFYNATSRTLSGLVGQVFQKPIQYDLDASFQFIIEDADGAGLSLEQHAKGTLCDVVSLGRAGLLVDAPVIEDGTVVTQEDIENGLIRPRIIKYSPEQIINWRETVVGGKTILTKIVLEESHVVEDDGFEYLEEPRWREIALDETGVVYVQLWKKEENEDGFIEDGEVKILIDKNSNPITEIPFTFVGVLNNDSKVDHPPLDDIAQLNISHYRDSADYQQSCFLVGQPTPIFTGITNEWADKHLKDPIMLGSSNAVSLPVGAGATLLQAQANSQPFESMKHKEDQMKSLGAKLIDPGSVQRTATEVEIEETSEASTLSSAAKNVSEAYEKSVYFCSLFIGPDLIMENINISLNSEFQTIGLSATERAEVISAGQANILTREEVRDVYKRKGIATLDNEEAFRIIDAEITIEPETNTEGDVNG